MPTADSLSTAPQPINAQEAYEIGFEAYTFFYPLVLMDVTRRVAANIEPLGKKNCHQ